MYPVTNRAPKSPMPGRLHHQHREIPARAALAIERIAGQLHARLLAMSVLERAMNAGIQLLQKLEGADDLPRPVQLAEPLVELRPVIRIARQSELDQLHLLFRGILERKETGIRIDQPVDRIVIAQIDVHFARHDQFVGRLRKCGNGDGISINIARPAHDPFGSDVKSAANDMDIVALARPHQNPVRTELYRLVVMVLGLVNDADALH